MDQEKHLCGKRIPASLTRAALHFWPFFSRPRHDQFVARPNLIYPADKDPVSVGLCKLGAQPSLFDVRAVVTSDLFPIPEASIDQQWSRMRRFRLEFRSLRPDGRWYFVGPGGEDPHDSEQGGYKISCSRPYAELRGRRGFHTPVVEPFRRQRSGGTRSTDGNGPQMGCQVYCWAWEQGAEARGCCSYGTNTADGVVAG